MNLQQILALLRGATTPEARTAAFASSTAQHRRDNYNALYARLSELTAIEARTPEQDAELTLCLDGCDALRAMVEADNALQARISVNERFATAPIVPAVFGGQMNGAPAAPAPEGARGAGVRVGTDLVQIGGRAVDHEGFGLSERQFNAIREPVYERAWIHFLRGRADMQERSVLAAGIDTDGGYFIPPQVLAEVIGPDPYPSGLLDSVRTLPAGSGQVMIPKNNYSGSDIYNSPYRKSRTSGVSGPTSQDALSLGMVECPIHESSIRVDVPRAMAEDSAQDIRSYAIEMMRDSYRLGTEYELALGTGVGQPEGILTNSGATGKVAEFNVGATPDLDKWVKLYREVPPMYRVNGILVMADAAYQDLESTEDTNGSFPFAVLNLTTSAGTNAPTERFRGKPIRYCPFYSDYGAGNKVGTWGDHARAYYYALRIGASLGVEDLATSSFLKLVMRIRDGGILALPGALRVAKAS